MKMIHMVDLVAQYNRLKPEIDEAWKHVLESATFINGLPVKSFSSQLAKYLDVEYVIPCANGTDAIMLSLMSLDLKPGDEVIVPDFTFISPVEAVAFLGLKPVIVDVEADSFAIDPSKIEEAITPKTKALIVAHLFGQSSANIDEIHQICLNHGITLIEDNAQSIGAKYIGGNAKGKMVGTHGTIGTTSFFPTKNLGCFGDGGAVFTNDSKLADKIRNFANHGSHSKYYHESVGINSRLDSLQAAILEIKLRHLDSFNKLRQNIAEIYDAQLGDCQRLKIPARNNISTHVFHQYTLTLDKPINKDIHHKLAQKGIPSTIHYPMPAHKQLAYKQFAKQGTSYSTSSSLCSRVLSLPAHSELDTEQLEYIYKNIKELLA